MLETPTPPEGYRLATVGKQYRFLWDSVPLVPLNQKWSYEQGEWVAWSDIYPCDWDHWEDQPEPVFAVPVAVYGDHDV